MNIRSATSADAAAIAAIYAPVVTDTATSFELTPPSPEEFAARIERVLARYPWLVAEQGGRCLGYAYGTVHRERAAYRFAVETSVYVDAAARGQGVGRGLYAELLRLLTERGFVQALAGITLPNAASVRLHESMGFERFATFEKIGWKFGAWHDVGWWRRDLASRDQVTG